MPSLEALSDHLNNFQLDRPTMNENNTPKVLAKLLANEGIEFKERLKINQGVIEIDLLALYEVADIIIFSIQLLQKLSQDPSEIIYEFEPEESQLQLLRKIGDSTSKISMWAEDGLPPEVIVQEVQDAAMYCIALIYSLGLDPMVTCFEKLGHNMSRYPAKRFQPNHDYETERKKCKRVATSYGLETTFYSPLIEGEDNPVYKITS